MRMKEKICGGLFVAAALTICALPIAKQTASASTVQDVTDSVSATGWIDHQELKVTYLDLGEGVEPDIGYGMIDGAYAYAQEYIAINGRTVKEINSDTTLGATAWAYNGMTYVPKHYQWTTTSHSSTDVNCYINGANIDFKNYSFGIDGRIKNTDVFKIMKGLLQGM